MEEKRLGINDDILKDSEFSKDFDEIINEDYKGGEYSLLAQVVEYSMEQGEGGIVTIIVEGEKTKDGEEYGFNFVTHLDEDEGSLSVMYLDREKMTSHGRS